MMNRTSLPEEIWVTEIYYPGDEKLARKLYRNDENKCEIESIKSKASFKF